MISKYNSTKHFEQTTQTNGTPYDRTIEPDWIIPIAINIILMVLTFWLLISLVHYGIKTKKWSHHHHSNVNSDVLNSGLVYGSVVLCGIMCMVRYIISQILMNIGYSENENELCEALADAAYACYAFVLCFVALFLWFRQRAFYAHRLLNVNYSKVIKLMSFVVIVFIVGYGVFVIILNTVPNNYSSSRKGCIRRREGSPMENWVAAAVGIAFYNLVLLGLLSYALTHIKTFQRAESKRNLEQSKARFKHNFLPQENKYKNNNNDTKNMTISEQTSTNNECKKSPAMGIQHRERSSSHIIKLILQKTLLFATISILVDIFLQVFANYIVNPDGHRRITNMFFDVSAFLNLLFVIFSFAAYKKMLMSPCRVK